MVLLLLLTLFLSQFILSSLLFVYSSFYLCNYYHQGYCFSYQIDGYYHYHHHHYHLKLRHLQVTPYCCYYYNIILITVFAVVSNQVISFVIIIMFTTINSIIIYSVGFIFLFCIFSICHGYCVTSLGIPSIYSLQLFSYSPTIYFR